ncbi:hypothetical protein EVAR_39117_1 [Eumeta japonica]|uniref:Uncharacterized protein n=1 Tax=Eumeta variegata TaxID=151549 RepID=A0A4C1X868_EUMVA|nr:hypothetical protein EVAR_39117_1 [Eumeta japonica]
MDRRLRASGRPPARPNAPPLCPHYSSLISAIADADRAGDRDYASAVFRLSQHAATARQAPVIALASNTKLHKVPRTAPRPREDRTKWNR